MKRHGIPTSTSATCIPVRPAALCRFYFNGGRCRNGDACRFSHDAGSGPCPFFAAGSCRYGDRCELRHEAPGEEADDDGDDDDATLCVICLENPSAKRRPFGILPGCDHLFCFQCVMAWRTEGSDDVTSRRVCPVCKKPSDYVVSSPRVPATAREKAALLRDHRAARAGKPCKHFDGTRGSCPFGRDCFYAHRDGEGRDIKQRDDTMQELYEARRRHRNNRNRRARARDVEEITNMLMMMGMQENLDLMMGAQRRRGRGQPGWRDEEEDDGSEEEVNMFLSPYMAFIASMLASDEDDDDSFDRID